MAEVREISMFTQAAGQRGTTLTHALSHERAHTLVDTFDFVTVYCWSSWSNLYTVSCFSVGVYRQVTVSARGSA